MRKLVSKELCRKTIQFPSSLELGAVRGPFTLRTTTPKLFWDFYSGSIRELLYGFRKTEPVKLHHEMDDISPLLATIAVVELLLFTDAKRRRTFSMKRAEADVICALLF
jgi:hypothetical protein